MIKKLKKFSDNCYDMPWNKSGWIKVFFLKILGNIAFFAGLMATFLLIILVGSPNESMSVDIVYDADNPFA